MAKLLIKVPGNPLGKIEVIFVEHSVMTYPTTCPTCGSKLVYNEYYNADFCPKCDLWLSEKCGESECGFHCAERPDRPSQVGPDKR